VSPAVIPTVVETPTHTSESGHPFSSRGGTTLDGAALHNVERVLTALEPRTPGDPIVLFELHERDQRARDYVEAHLQYPPNDDMTAEGGELQIFIGDAVETSTINTSEYVGPSVNTTEDC